MFSSAPGLFWTRKHLQSYGEFLNPPNFFEKKFRGIPPRLCPGCFSVGWPPKSECKGRQFFRTDQMFREKNLNFSANLTFDALPRWRRGCFRAGKRGVLGVWGESGGLGETYIAQDEACSPDCLHAFFDMLALVRGCSLFYSLVFLTDLAFFVGRALLLCSIY